MSIEISLATNYKPDGATEFGFYYKILLLNWDTTTVSAVVGCFAAWLIGMYRGVTILAQRPYTLINLQERNFILLNEQNFLTCLLQVPGFLPVAVLALLATACLSGVHGGKRFSFCHGPLP